MRSLGILRMETVETYDKLQALSHNPCQDSCWTGVVSTVTLSQHPGLFCIGSMAAEVLWQGALLLFVRRGGARFCEVERYVQWQQVTAVELETLCSA